MNEGAPTGLRILFVEDQPDDIDLQRRQLEREGLVFELRTAASEAQLRHHLEHFVPGVVLCDYSIPGFSGREALRIVKELAPQTPFIFVSGTIGEETAVECLHEGAIDYVLKGNPRRLGSAVRRALREAEERRSYESRLRYLANYDAATDLPNRALLLDRMDQALKAARRTRKGFTLLGVCVDGLRLVDEGFGHAAADEAIRHVAERIGSVARRDDTVARIGGDEFAVLLPDLDQPQDIHPYARRILDAIKAPYAVGGTRLVMTASASGAVFPGDGGDAETLLRNSSAAARAAREGGRDTFRFCSPDNMRAALERILLEAALSQASERGILEVHFQTQHELATGAVCGAEALLRWKRDDGTWVPPALFIGVAEDTGLIRAIGEQVLHDACVAALPWIDGSNPAFTLGVNVSTVQLRDDEFVEKVSRALQATGFPVACLELEMTESALMSGDHGDLDTIARLKALGVKIAIDDFGTGYSSLSYLSRLPVDRLKIDGSFVSRMLDNPRDAAIVQSILSLGQGLGLEVIAEGIETEAQCAALRAMGCDKGQGHFFSPAVVPSDIRRMLGRTPHS